MPGIPPDHMHILVKHFVGTRPSSILDIGLSYGHIDFIDRDFCVALMDKPFRNKKSEMLIDGIETFPDEKQNVQPDFYDTVYKGDIFQVIERLETYDMIVLGDVLEHLEKRQALQLLDECIAHSDNHLMVCVSLGEKEADNNICGRIYDKPVSFWSHEDFGPFVYPQKFLQYTTENHGIFLVNKEDYIDHKIVELYPLPKNNGVNTSFNLR